MSALLDTLLEELPLIAILRGITPKEAVPVGVALMKAGFRIIEVPLNSPDALESLAQLSATLGTACLLGAGTVLSASAVSQIAEAGGRLVVTPHCDASVIRAAKAAGLFCTPGFATPSEGFAAIALGADALKMFPAEALPPAALRAMRSVFPVGTRIIPVGGIDATNMGAYLEAGAAGFGFGSALYKPGLTAPDVAIRAEKLVAAWRQARKSVLF